MEGNNKHPKNVAGFSGSLQELAHATGRMRYDRVAEYLKEFSIDLKSQAYKDLNIRERAKLAEKLFKAAEFLYQAKIEIDGAWKICKQFMKEDE